MADAHGAPAPFELIRWTLAERFGWTLDYINTLTLGDLGDWFQICDGRSKARKRNG